MEDKKRNLEYEKKFRAYLFSFDGETHKEICKHINVVPSTHETRSALKNGSLYKKNHCDCDCDDPTTSHYISLECDCECHKIKNKITKCLEKYN